MGIAPPPPKAAMFAGMSLGTSPGSESPSPLAPTVRAARADDYGAFVRIFPELGVDDPIVSAERFAREMTPTTFVAESDGEVIGYVFFQLLSGVAYVRHVAVSPSARRRGVGRALMAAVATRAREAGVTTWVLNVKPHNVAAIALYEGLGMQRTYLSQAVKIAWDDLDRVPASPGIDVRPLTEEEEPAIETALRMIPGQLGTARALGGRLLLVAHANDALVGAAVFDPAFPGCQPFRARSPEVAFALLRAMRPHKREGDAIVNMMIEDARAVTDAIVAAGGTLRLEIQNMRGPLLAP